MSRRRARHALASGSRLNEEHRSCPSYFYWVVIAPPDPSSQTQSLPADGDAIPLVRVVTPQRAVIHREVSQPGTIEAFEETAVFAKVAGYVKKWHVDIGESVREGQLLAELSVPELEVELEQKESLIRLADEQVKQARKLALVDEAAVKSAEAKIREAEAAREQAAAERKRAQSQYERLARAGQGGVIEKESIEENRLSFDAAEAGLKQAEARVLTAQAMRDESRAKRDKARADVRVAEANRKVAHNNRDYVKAQLKYTRLTAPYDGIVSHHGINTGDFVQSVTSGKGKPIYIVQRTDLLRIFVQVPETDSDWVRKRGRRAPPRPGIAGSDIYRAGGADLVVARSSDAHAAGGD